MQRRSHHSVADGQIGSVPFAAGKAHEIFRSRQRDVELATVQPIAPEAPNCAQLVLGCADSLGNAQGFSPSVVRLAHRPLGMKQRCGKRRVKVHLAARADACVQDCDGALGVQAALRELRQFDPERNCCNSQRDRDRRIAVGRKRPVERRTQIIDLADVVGQPFVPRPLGDFSFGALLGLTTCGVVISLIQAAETIC